MDNLKKGKVVRFINTFEWYVKILKHCVFIIIGVIIGYNKIETHHCTWLKCDCLMLYHINVIVKRRFFSFFNTIFTKYLMAILFARDNRNKIG